MLLWIFDSHRLLYYEQITSPIHLPEHDINNISAAHRQSNNLPGIDIIEVMPCQIEFASRLSSSYPILSNYIFQTICSNAQ